MKNTLIYLILFSFCLFLPNCDDGCSDAAIDYGLADVYDVSQKMFDIYKSKKLLVLRNENGDTLNFNIRYSTIIRNDTAANTLKADGGICTAEVYHVKIINLDLVRENNNYNFFVVVQSDFDYVHRGVNKRADLLVGGWKEEADNGLYDLEIAINNPSSNKIPHKTVVIHGKNVEVMEYNGKKPERVFVHEDKGILALTVPGKGAGLWVVDKIE